MAKKPTKPDKSPRPLERSKSLAPLPSPDTELNNLTNPPVPAGELPLPTRFDAVLNPEFVINTVVALLEHWQQGAGEAHERLYRFLGMVYEWGPRVKSQDGLEDAVVKAIEKRHGSKVKPNKISGEALLLMLAAGFSDTAKASRSQWGKALGAAKQEGVSRNDFELARWMRDVGGMKKAGSLLRTEKSDRADFDPAVYFAPSFKLGPKQFVEFDVVPELADERGLRLAIVDLSARSENGKLRAQVGLITDEKGMLAGVAKRHQQLARLFWRINRYALKHAKHGLLGKVAKSDVEAFAEAVSALLANEDLRGRYFEEGAFAPQVPEDVSAETRFPVLDLALNVHDPARFIHGARPGALLPYEPDPKPWDKLTEAERWDTQVPAYANQFLKTPIRWLSEKEIADKKWDLARKTEQDQQKADERSASVKEVEDV